MDTRGVPPASLSSEVKAKRDSLSDHRVRAVAIVSEEYGLEAL